jgi:hypothetical protein
LGTREVDWQGCKEAREHPETPLPGYHNEQRRLDDWLRDSELLLLAEAILKNEVFMKSNKITGQRETITLNDWCMMWKYDRVIKNEFMFEFKRKPLPSKKTGFQKYTDEEWEELALEKNFTDAVISNIREEVMTLKDKSDWVSGRLNNLNPTNAKNASAPNVYILAVQKFVKCTVGMSTRMGAVKYEVRVSRTLQETIESLRAPSSFSRSLKEKAEIFLYLASTALVKVCTSGSRSLSCSARGFPRMWSWIRRTPTRTTTMVQSSFVQVTSLEENHVLCNRTKNDYMSYATQKRLQRPYVVSTLTCTGL